MKGFTPGVAFQTYSVSREIVRINSISPPAVPSRSPTMLIQLTCSQRSSNAPSRYPATVPAGSMNASWLYLPNCTHGFFFLFGPCGSGDIGLAGQRETTLVHQPRDIRSLRNAQGPIHHANKLIGQ